ncbi:YbhB/YbcL family Raf kinase inhibitor-like protein [Halomarina litorea]|uniref:YbhB/YbcL family Raf kinase inhibitor-like protein n=1 Tax=Halomarina litorea TaxID=2961595 RepID=UPI0020C523AC|nr:YbhB/YbcL family Raf kinase inhibitor-like protein [Halomarina sp. BCD28]
MERRAFLAAAGAATASLAGCVDGEETGNNTTTTRTNPTSTVTVSFEVPPLGSNRPVPEQYACTGENVSPEVALVEIGNEAESVAVSLHDADADDALHWSVWGIGTDLPRLPESLPRDPEVRLSEVTPNENFDATVFQGRNYRDEVGYYGPCPPEGERHTYLFTVSALDTTLDLEPGASPDAFREALEGSVVGRASVGTFFER